MTRDDLPPPIVTVQGAPAGPSPPPRGGRSRLALPLLLLAAAGVASVVAALPPAPPEPDCGPLCRDPLVIGVALPLSGVLAPFGAAQQRGVEQVVDEVNAAGGWEVGGRRRPVELLLRDTRSLSDVAGQQALVLARGPFDVVALLGPCAPPLAMVRVAESRGVPLVAGCQALPPVGPAGRRYTWEVAPTEADRAAAVFEALRAARGRRVALFLSNDRPAEAWAAAAAQAGFSLVGTFRPQGAEWAPAVALAARQRPDLVVAVTQPPEGIALWRELAAQQVRPELAYATDAATGSAWSRAAGSSGEGVLTDAVHTPTAAPAIEVRAGSARADDAVAAVSAELTRVLLDGLRRAGDPTRRTVNDALTSATGSVDGTVVRFAGDRSSRLPHRLARWQGGELVPVP